MESLIGDGSRAKWDGCHDDPITVAEMHAVAANWRDTTQLSNALDAAAWKCERYESALRLIVNQATDLPHASRIDRDEMRSIARDALGG